MKKSNLDKILTIGFLFLGGFVSASYTTIVETDSNYSSSSSNYESSQGDPAGTVMLWGKGALPDGWIELDGSSTESYPELMSIYGATLPDMKGNFVRGHGGNSGSLNTFQAESMKAHTHSATFTGNALPSHSHTGVTMSGTESHGNKSNDAANDKYYNQTTSSVSAGTPTGSVSMSSQGGSEIRPTNVALKFIVKTSD